MAASSYEGGIILFWKQRGLGIRVISSTSQVMHLRVHELDLTWVLLATYVQPHCQLKDIFWDEQKNFSSNLNLLWILMGDLNDIASLKEKYGRSKFCVNHALAFVERWDAYQLSDIGVIGTKFTLFRKINGRIMIKERLDKVLLNFVGP